MDRRQFAGGAAATAAALLGGWQRTALAQAWPNKPIKLVLSQAPGSGVDSIARIITERLGHKWGQVIVVENKPGGQNAIGAQQAARAAPDGYNFYVGTLASLVTNAYLFKNMPYDPRKDFVPVGMIGKVPFVISANASTSIKTVQDLVAQAKAQPGKLPVADEGPKTFSGMLSRVIAKQLGIDVNHVPYVSVGAAVTDTVGGQVDALVCDVTTAMPMIRNGRLRPLAVTTGKRVLGLEQVPTLAEARLPGFDFAGWMAFAAPTGTPASVLQRFNRDLDAVLLDKDVAARLQAIGPITEGAGTLEQTAAFVQGEHARWSKLIRDLGIQPE